MITNIILFFSAEDLIFGRSAARVSAAIRSRSWNDPPAVVKRSAAR
ncbi:hypothetical protein [Rhizobium leguminosarum]|nr:hypothetical protein [Rhizobium leguminosarum]MBY5792661.1 hypothetical protein [Rhizobium leguminosarum]